MIDRRRAAGLVLAALAALAARPLPARAQAFQPLIPFLVDLPGWTGAKADGLAMEMQGVGMITATREYERGDARLSAQIIIGPAAQGALGATEAGVKIETSDARLSTSSIDGLQVTRSFTVSDKSGAIIVALGASALFSLTFNDIGEDDALALARKFDWKAMQAAIPK